MVSKATNLCSTFHPDNNVVSLGNAGESVNTRDPGRENERHHLRRRVDRLLEPGDGSHLRNRRLCCALG